MVLPPLDQMDGFIRGLFSGLSSHPQLLAWLATDDLVGSLATAIDRLANGQTPARDLAPLRPGTGFAVVTRRGVPYVDPASYARYDAIVQAATSVDPARLATIYATIEPRLAEAYARQGHAGSLRDAVQRANATILATPDPPAEIPLVAGVGGYAYADPRLEALTPAQKHLLRMGPANLQKVREAVRQFAAALPPAARGRSRDQWIDRPDRRDHPDHQSPDHQINRYPGPQETPPREKPCPDLPCGGTGCRPRRTGRPGTSSGRCPNAGRCGRR